MIDAAAGLRTDRTAGAPALAAAYGVAAAAFAAYAIWGSLFPFDFHRHLVADVVALSDLWSADRRSLSLTDLASNILLFLPIGLFLAAFAAKRSRPRGPGVRVLAATFLCSVALSIAVEIGQAFVPTRTPSMLDVAAEATGSAAGIVLWRIAAAELDALLLLVVDLMTRASRAERTLLAYAVLFAVWWWLPADFTLRPGEIADKFAHKRLLLPFVPSPDAVSPFGLIVTAAAAIPIGIAAAICGRPRDSHRSIAKALGIAMLFVLALALGQVPVFSRTTDGAAALEAMAGTALGAVAIRRSRRPHVDALRTTTLGTAACAAAWFVVAVVCEWWPFAIVLDPDRAHVQMTLWSLAPFRGPSGAAAVVPGVALAAAAGLLVRARLSPQFIRLQSLAALALAGGVCLAFEVGRLLLANGRPTLVTVALEWAAFGAALCAWPARGAALVRRTESC